MKLFGIRYTHWTSLTKQCKPRRRGQALVLVVGITVLLVALGMTSVGLVSTNQREVTTQRVADQLMAAAHAGNARAVFLLQQQYFAWLEDNGETAPGNQDLVRQYLEGNSGGLNPTLSAGGTATLPMMRFHSSTTVTGEELWITTTLERQDSGTDSTFVRLRSEATTWNPGSSNQAAELAAGRLGEQRVVESVMRYGGEVWDGLDFVILANQVACIFCHASFDNAERVYNHDPSQFGDFDRVRLGVLQTTEFRPGANSYIAGTFYVGGSLVDKNGNAINLSNSAFTANDGLKAGQMDSSGRITENNNSDAYNRITKETFVEGHKDGDGNYDTPYASFYRDYPSDPNKQIDGGMPSEFPPPIPDTDEDRIIDDSEWTATTGTYAGTITGGSRTLINNSSTYTDVNLPSSGSATIPTGGTSDKSVILVGTESDPIVLDGEVAIDGDVVIAGVVKGSGQIMARGNVYIMGDLRYADGTDGDGNRTFGVADDGTKNAIAYAAGGSIIHGKFMWGDGRHSDKYFGLEGWAEDGHSDNKEESGLAPWEAGKWNRMEWTRTMPYFDDTLDMPTLEPVNSSTGDANPVNTAYDPTYKPRFYTFNQHDPANDSGKIWVHEPNKNYKAWDGVRARWNNSGGFWEGEGNGGDFYKNSVTYQDLLNDMTIDPAHPDAAALEAKKAALLDQSNYATNALFPKWMDPEKFADLVKNAEADRKAERNGKPYELDGLFYTNNGMLFISRKSDSGNRKIIFNGSIVSADIGILGPKGVKVNYDERVKEYLNIENPNRVELFTTFVREGIR